MMARRTNVLGSFVVLAVTPMVPAQIVDPPQVVPWTAGDHWFEPSIANRRAAAGNAEDEVLVAAMNVATAPSRVGYAVTLNGFSGATPFSAHGYLNQFLPNMDPCFGPSAVIDRDVSVMRDPASGYTWLAAAAGGKDKRGWIVARKAAGAADFASSVNLTAAVCQSEQDCCSFIEKQLFAMGPGPGGSGLAMYVAHENYALLGPTGSPYCHLELPGKRLNRLWFASSTSGSAATLGDSWAGQRRIYPLQSEFCTTAWNPEPCTTSTFCVPSGPPHTGCANFCEFWGRFPAPLVLPSGRLVVAAADTRQRWLFNGIPQADPAYTWVYNRGLPWVTVSDDGGATWLDRANLAPVGPLPNLSWDADGTEGSPPQLAYDPTAPNRVFVAFTAIADFPGETPPSTNKDVCVALSTDGGSSFLPTNVLRLSDQLLGITTATWQWPNQLLPAIAIDGCGGVNLMFYDNSQVSVGDNRRDWWYVRITGFGTAQQAIFKFRLTPASFSTAGHGLGHYFQITASEHRVFLAYPVRGFDPNFPTTQALFVRRVIVCPADVSVDGLYTPGDVAAFGSAYISNSSEADVNGDSTVNISDVTLFNQAYSCQCTPSP